MEVKVKALKPTFYKGIKRERGDEFTMNKNDANIFNRYGIVNILEEIKEQKKEEDKMMDVQKEEIEKPKKGKRKKRAKVETK